MPKVSVIMPVYNVAKYLPMCLESIVSQTLTDIEILCVNDGSTDNSLDVLQQFEEKDKRIIIIDKKNEGSGIARNTALERAQGEYVYFVYSDDWLDNNDVLKKITERADSENLDILIFGGLSCYENNGKIKKSKGGYSLKNLPNKYKNRVFSSKDIRKDIFKFPSTVWTKLYRREFLIKNNIKFQTLGVGQDQLPFFHSMITGERIAVLDECLYCYRKNRAGSAMTVKKKKNFSPIYVVWGIEELLKNLGMIEDYDYLFINKYFGKATSWLGNFQEDLKDDYYKEYMKLLEHLKRNYKGWWKYFNPQRKDGYWKLKTKQFLAKQKYAVYK